MSKHALLDSIVFAAVGCFLITWVNEAGTLKGWGDLVSFYFVSKVVSTFVTLTGINVYLSSKTYKGDSTEVIEKRIVSDISELKKNAEDAAKKDGEGK